MNIITQYCIIKINFKNSCFYRRILLVIVPMSVRACVFILSTESEIEYKLRFSERLSLLLFFFFFCRSFSQRLLYNAQFSSTAARSSPYQRLESTFFSTYILFLFHNFFTRVFFLPLFSFALRIRCGQRAVQRNPLTLSQKREISIYERARVVINFCVRLPRDTDRASEVSQSKRDYPP